MPELPEVETVVRSIAPLVGRRIVSAEFRCRRILRGADPLTTAVLGSAGAFLTGLASLVRPEMPLLFAIAATVFALRWWRRLGLRGLMLSGAMMTIAFLLPLVPWAARNFVALQEVRISAPRYATMPGEYAPVGYFSWSKTWMVRYRDVYLSLWKIGDEPLNIDDIPETAFDSPEEKSRVSALFDQYNDSPNLDIAPELDNQFARMARERTRRHPLRTYLSVPFERALTMWFTPRTELLPINGKIWPLTENWNASPLEFIITAGLGALGYLYVALAIGGIWTAWRYAERNTKNNSTSAFAPNNWGIALLLVYMFLRTAFLTTVEAPEPRYVITCYPAVLALGALVWVGAQRRAANKSGG